MFHDNAQHIAKQTTKKLPELKCEVFSHFSYSSDFSPTDYHLFKPLWIFERKVLKNEVNIKNVLDEFIDLHMILVSPNEKNAMIKIPSLQSHLTFV